MNLALLLTTVLAVATDPTSARAVASRNERLILEGEAALAQQDGPTALARALVIDGDDRRLDRPRLLLLRGRARALVGLATDAVADLRAARAATHGKDDTPTTIPGLGREIARQERARGAFDACADELAAEFNDVGPEPINDDDALLWATCLRATSRRAGAHDVLVGHDSPAVRRLRATMLLEDGLPRLARADVAALVDDPGVDLSVDDLLSFARAFRSQDDPSYAALLIDVAMARFPDDVVAATAADVSGAHHFGAHAGGALMRRTSLVAAGRPDDLRSVGLPAAAWRATLLTSGTDRLRQRLALLVDARAWERVVLLAPRLRAAGLLSGHGAADNAGANDDVAYAVAFAATAIGNFDVAEAALDAVTTSAGFTRATELRAAIAACREASPDTQETRCPR